MAGWANFSIGVIACAWIEDAKCSPDVAIRWVVAVYLINSSHVA